MTDSKMRAVDFGTKCFSVTYFRVGCLCVRVRNPRKNSGRFSGKRHLRTIEGIQDDTKIEHLSLSLFLFIPFAHLKLSSERAARSHTN
jgi:hypothetical protein